MPERFSGFNPEEEPKEEEKNISRRQFLKGVAALGAAAMIGERGLPRLTSEEPEEPESETVDLELKNEVPRPRNYHTGKLEGRNFADLYKYYTGIEGEAPAVVRIDFVKQLTAMWNEKFRRNGRTPQTDSVFKSIKREYSESLANPMTIEEYLDVVRDSVDKVRGRLNWAQLIEIKNLDPDEASLVKKIALSLRGRDFCAYSLTEFMPSTDGDFNVEVMDFLLRNAGSRYIYSLPAIYDDLVSFGPYQFTSNALFEKGKEKHGASVVNSALPESNQIPGSVANLRGNLHHHAAFLFALENICNLVKRLNSKQKKVLAQVADSHHDELVEFIATAHNKPAHAYDSAERWLDHGAKQDYVVSCGRGIRSYAQKTKANLKALDERWKNKAHAKFAKH